MQSIDIPAFAATTLLMALHHQRHNKDARKARAVFNYFFKVANDYYLADGRSHSHAHSPHSHAHAGDAHTHEDGSECFCMGAVDCGEKCTARVLQAFALFESKNSLRPKSKFLIRRAMEYDPSVASLLRWKIFQDGADSGGLATA